MACGNQKAWGRSNRWLSFASLSLRALFVLLTIGFLAPEVSYGKTGHWLKQGPSVLQPPSEPNNQEAPEDLDLVWGPETFHGRIFKPHTQSQNLELARGGYLLVIENGLPVDLRSCPKERSFVSLICRVKQGLAAFKTLFTRVHAGHVWLNQNLVLTPGSLNITTQEVRIPIELSEDTSTLSLKLKGFPGSFVKVSIYGEGSNQPPILNLTWSTDQPLEDEVVLFDAMASTDPDGSVSEVHFDWGDNTTSTGFVAEHAWSLAGVYVVTVTVTDDDGAQTSVPIEYTVLPKPKPPTDGGGIFFVTTTDHVPTKALFFTLMPAEDQDGGQIVSYTWDFGIGKILTLYPHETDLYASVEHYYQNTGVYQVTLTITDDSGLSTSTSRQIEIVPNQPPVPHISVNQASGPAPLTVTFDASESFDPENDEIRYRWRFGDNSPEVIGTDQAVVSHTYSQPGTYTVRLRLRDQFLARREVTTQIVVGETDANVPPTPVLISSGLLGQSPFTVQLDASQSFDIDSGDSISQVEWTFGDDHDPIDFTQGAMTSHTFNYPGSYYGRLTVRDSQGKSSVEHFTVHVLSSDPAKVDFLAQANPSDPLELWFDNSVGLTTAPIEYHNFHWFYGDNSYARGRNQSHTYPGPGPYEVQLSAFDVLGQRYLTKKTVNVQHTSADLPVAIALDNYSPSVNEEIQIWLDTFDLNQVADFNLKWDLGDGTVLTGLGSDLHSISHTYAKSGLYKITLSLTNPENLTTRLETEINVYSGTPPLPLFIATPLVGQAPVEVSFNGSYTWDSDDQVTTWIWSWGDGQKSISGPYESHTYQEPGQYFPSLTVIDQAGNYATHTAEIRVLSAPPPLDNQPPVAEIVALTPTTGTAPLRVEVDAYNSYDNDGAIIEYRWTTSNGMTWVGPYFVISFDQPGSHSIALTVTDDMGAQSVATVAVSVIEETPPPEPAFTIWPPLPTSNEMVRFSALNADPSRYTYEWIFPNGHTLSGSSVEQSFADPGVYSVRLNIYEASVQLGSLMDSLEVFAPTAPIAKIKVAHLGGVVGLASIDGETLFIDELPAVIEFDGLGSHDDHSVGLTYHWSFSDNSNSSLPIGKHMYYQEGVYPVTLTVTNDSGMISTASVTVQIEVNDVNCVLHEGDEACHYIEEATGNIVPITGASDQRIRLRNTLFAPYQDFASGLPEESSSYVTIVYDNQVERLNYINISDLAVPVGNLLEIDIGSALARVPDLGVSYWIEISGTNDDGLVNLSGSTPKFFFGSSQATVALPSGEFNLQVTDGSSEFIREFANVSGQVVLTNLPKSSYSVVGKPSHGSSIYATFDIVDPYSSVYVQAQSAGSPYQNSQNTFAVQSSLSSQSRSSLNSGSEPGPLLPNPFPGLFPKGENNAKTAKIQSDQQKTLGMAALGGEEIEPNFNLSVFGYQYTPGWTGVCGSPLAPYPGITHASGPHSDPNLINRQYTASDPWDPHQIGHISSIEPLPTHLKEINVVCNLQGASVYRAVDLYKDFIARPQYCYGTSPFTQVNEWFLNHYANRIKYEKTKFILLAHFLDNNNNYLPNSMVTIVDSFAEYRKRTKLTNDVALTMQHMIPSGASTSDWGGNWKYTLAVPKELRSYNPASLQSNQSFGKIQLQMIPTAPQQWETEYRAHCYVSFPKVDYIKLTAINKGTNGDADQPSVPSSQQASQIYSSTGDAQRSLSKTEGLFPVDLDLTGLFQSTETSNTYKNRGGRFVPRYSFTAEYNEDKVIWNSVRVFVGNESHDLLEFDLPLR
ncbi:MAG: PKD domain-containing protein, partial [Bdellovibrionales bacterium]|nr:PKD domain-containing protein [Bdellovibrionales bacterium]